MKYKEQWECLDKYCKTVVVGHRHRLDGIRCPRCEGPVVQMSFNSKMKQPSERALFVRRMILDNCHEHCRELTPEQVDTVLSLGDLFVEKGNKKTVEITIDGRQVAKHVIDLAEQQRSREKRCSKLF